MTTQAETFLARAAEARAEADAAALTNVRERCLRAASAWEAMAERAARTDRFRSDQEAKSRAAAAQLAD